MRAKTYLIPMLSPNHCISRKKKERKQVKLDPSHTFAFDFLYHWAPTITQTEAGTSNEPIDGASLFDVNRSTNMQHATRSTSHYFSCCIYSPCQYRYMHIVMERSLQCKRLVRNSHQKVACELEALTFLSEQYLAKSLSCLRIAEPFEPT